MVQFRASEKLTDQQFRPGSPRALDPHLVVEACQHRTKKLKFHMVDYLVDVGRPPLQGRADMAVVTTWLLPAQGYSRQVHQKRGTPSRRTVRT